MINCLIDCCAGLSQKFEPKLYNKHWQPCKTNQNHRCRCHQNGSHRRLWHKLRPATNIDPKKCYSSQVLQLWVWKFCTWHEEKSSWKCSLSAHCSNASLGEWTATGKRGSPYTTWIRMMPTKNWTYQIYELTNAFHIFGSNAILKVSVSYFFYFYGMTLDHILLESFLHGKDLVVYVLFQEGVREQWETKTRTEGLTQ